MNQLYARLKKTLRVIFDFRQPRFRHLDCLDLVLENKLLLLVSWEAVHSCKICIRPGNIVYRHSSSAAICRLPFNTGAIDIILRNFWRSKKITFKLKRIALDAETLLHVEDVYLQRLTLTHISPGIKISSTWVEPLQPWILLSMHVPSMNISINQLQLNDYAT